MKEIITASLIGLGVLLVVLSSSWAALFPGTSSWTPEKAERLTELRRTLHNLAIAAGSPANEVNPRVATTPAAAKAEFDRLKPECDRLLSEVKNASESPHRVSTLLRWSGISLAGVGLVGWYAVRQTSG